MASSAGSDDDGNKKKEEEAPPAWDPLPAADPGYCAVMGGAEEWPALPGSAAAAAKAKGPSSSAATAAPQSATKPPTPRGDFGASSSISSHGDRAAPAAAPERRRADAVPETSSPPMPQASSNNHVNGSGFRGRQNGRSAPQHPRGRGGGGGYNNNNGGSRRPAIGGANGRGDINVHVHINGNNVNGGGGWHGQEPRRGGFNNGQRRGRGHGHQHGNWHGPGHRPSGPQMEPPFVPMVAPPYYDPSYYDPYYGYGPCAYAPECYYFPPPQEGHGFVPYPALPMQHMMPPQWEQQGPYMGPQAQQQPAQEQQKATTTTGDEQRQDAPASAEEVHKSLRAQIEYYFSSNNLCTDAYLRQRMDEQGWVPLTVIASFPRVKERTTDMDFIMSSVLASDEVEVQDGKIRKRIGWEKYPLLRSNCS